ncbi:SCO1664 family protein [Georgenia satyanarayanai]|uniref:SCO1664 family protein n=1 Tax=Georgenia satyanarayanai TaxID=860221 RepID=UPI00203F5DD4|nr:SCO1664 family protein [Georgenia satyanarayanai]MCM3659933.1 SCO1664 family protein [Georgenia satyanarayanai]
MTPELADGDIVLDGRITTASNATFLGHIGELSVVYKPVAGERPLWDFPDGTLAQRELASYLLSEALGWDVVPRTWLHEGPLGPGMAQLWCEPDPAQDAVTLVPADEVPGEGWCHVLSGVDEEDREVALLHEDSLALRRMAVFDVLANNADRKAGHVLAMAGGHRYGVDHGLTFHAEHKLRTVLWGWAGGELEAEEADGVGRVRAALGGDLGAALAGLLTEVELTALAARCERLLATGRLPAPREGYPPIPWPPF